MRLRLSAPHNVRTGERQPLNAFAAQGTVHAVAGIGNPQRFFRMLRRAGLSIVEHAFPDHHPFVANDLRFADDRAVLMTAKDAVKCEAFADHRVWEVAVDAEFAAADGERLLALVSSVLQTAPRG